MDYWINGNSNNFAREKKMKRILFQEVLNYANLYMNYAHFWATASAMPIEKDTLWEDYAHFCLLQGNIASS